jgi:Mrp family chromosome partitioning ATPase
MGPPSSISQMMRKHKDFQIPNRNAGSLGLPTPTNSAESKSDAPKPYSGERIYSLEMPERGVLCYWHAFRRRWLSILGLGLLFSLAVGLPVQRQQAPSYSASTLLRMSTSNRSLVFESQAVSNDLLETARLTYKQLVSSRPVVELAVKNPGISALDDVKKQPDANNWLQKKIAVKFLDKTSEIMELSVKDANPEQAALFSNAVADAFIQWCASTQRSQRLKQIEELQRAFHDKQTGLTELQAQCADLVEAAGGVDAETLARRGDTAVQRLAELQKEKTRLKIDLQRAESEYESQKKMRIDPANPRAVDKDLAGIGQNDPLATKLLLELDEMEQYSSRIKAVVSPEAVGRLERQGQLADVALARKHYLARLAELQRRKEASIAADIDKLHSQIGLIERQTSQFESEIEEQNTEAEKKRTSLVEVKLVKADIHRTEEVIGQLTQKIKEVEVELGSTPPMSLVQRAEVPAAACNKSITSAIVMGTYLLCFLLPGACIIGWDVFRCIVNGPHDVPGSCDLSVLGSFPVAKKGRFNLRHPLRCFRSSPQRLIDAAESLQTMLLHDHQGHNRVVMICGAENNDGTPALAEALAIGLANHNYRTVLVDANLRHPRLHRKFGVPLAEGVSETLCERVEIWDVLHETEIEDLYFASAGEWNDKIHASMVRGNAASLIDTLRSIYQFVIISGGPVLQGSEARFFGRYADAVLFSVQRDVTRVDQAIVAVDILRTLNGNILGATVAV